MIQFCLLLSVILAWHPFYGTYANCIAPDVTPHNAASHLGLFCLFRFSLKNGIKLQNQSKAP